MPGAVALTTTNQFVVVLPDRLATVDESGRSTARFEFDGEGGDRRFNDAAVDPLGRLLAGSMPIDLDGPPAGRLYSVNGNRAQLLLEGIGLPNGLDWSPDSRTLYFTDSTAGAVGLYRYDVATGTIERQHGALELERGTPDGHTVDADGNLWVAAWSAGEVVCLTPTGRVIATVTLPVSNPTSCTFGGPDLDTLYITTAASEGSTGAREPHSGSIFACVPGAIGRLPNRMASDA
jgi:sugar lactone lactonase YvrE